MTDWQVMHPDDGELLRYADGELPLRQARRVRAHLARCWQCRVTLGEIERTIRGCVDYRRTVLETCMPEPPQPWFDIRRWLADLEAAREGQPWWGRLRRGFVWSWLTAPRLAVVAVVAAILWAQTTLIFRNRELARPAPAAVTPTAPPAPPRAEPAAALSPRPAGPPVIRPLELATASDELRVFALLRRLGADLGEPVEVTRENGRVLVTGIGVSPEVERALARELETSPRFLMKFSAPTPVERRAASTLTIRPEITRLQAELEQRLGGRTAYDELANSLLETTDELLAHLYALRRLAERFPPEVETELGPDDRRLLASLRSEHAAAAGKLAAALEECARPAFASYAIAEVAAPEAGSARSWQTATADLLGLARRTETLLAAILGGSVSPEPAATLPGEFLRSAAQLRRQAEAFLRDAPE